MNSILSCIFGFPLTKNVCIFSREEIVNIHFLLLLEDIKNNKKERHDGYCEVGMDNASLLLKASGSVAAPKTVSILKNNYNLKLKFAQKGKVRMRIIDNKGKPFYLRKFDPSSTKETLINISDWENGEYNIEFSDLSGMTIASGEFKIC